MRGSAEPGNQRPSRELLFGIVESSIGGDSHGCDGRDRDVLAVSVDGVGCGLVDGHGRLGSSTLWSNRLGRDRSDCRSRRLRCNRGSEISDSPRFPRENLSTRDARGTRLWAALARGLCVSFSCVTAKSAEGKLIFLCRGALYGISLAGSTPHGDNPRSTSGSGVWIRERSGGVFGGIL